MSNADTEPLSEYEQPLSIRERDAGIVTARDTDTHVTDTAARVRGEWRHAVAMSNMDTKPLREYEQPLPIRELRERDAGLSRRRGYVMPFTDTIDAHQRGQNK